MKTPYELIGKPCTVICDGKRYHVSKLEYVPSMANVVFSKNDNPFNKDEKPIAMERKYVGDDDDTDYPEFFCWGWPEGMDWTPITPPSFHTLWPIYIAAVSGNIIAATHLDVPEDEVMAEMKRMKSEGLL